MTVVAHTSGEPDASTIASLYCCVVGVDCDRYPGLGAICASRTANDAQRRGADSTSGRPSGGRRASSGTEHRCAAAVIASRRCAAAPAGV